MHAFSDYPDIVRWRFTPSVFFFEDVEMHRVDPYQQTSRPTFHLQVKGEVQHGSPSILSQVTERFANLEPRTSAPGFVAMALVSATMGVRTLPFVSKRSTPSHRSPCHRLKVSWAPSSHHRYITPFRKVSVGFANRRFSSMQQLWCSHQCSVCLLLALSCTL